MEKDLNVYRIRITVKSPLVIADHPIGRIWSTSASFLPGSTVRGGILSKILLESPEYTDDVRNESVEPTILFQPAYPVCEGEVLRPSDPFVYSCKICEDIVPPYRVDLSVKTDLNPPVRCNNGHLKALKSLGGKLVDHSLKEVKECPRYTYLDNVGLNKILDSSEPGMLFSYIGISPGNIFEGYIVDLTGKFKRIVSGVGENFIAIFGRGGSRGYGYSDVTLEEINLAEYLDNRVSEISGFIRDGYVVLKAISPIISFGKDGLKPKPKVDPLILDEYIPFRDYEFNYALTGYYMLRGFGRYSELPKAKVKGAAPGSIYFYKIVSEVGKASKYLAERELLGFDPFSHIGVNYIEVIRWK